MCEPFNGWTNRETWAFMLHVNNDQGLQSEAHDVVRAWRSDDTASIALKLWARTLLTRAEYVNEFGSPWPDALADMAEDVGSLYRVNWQECAESFLADIAEETEYANA